jgi:hypothetical protein
VLSCLINNLRGEQRWFFALLQHRRNKLRWFKSSESGCRRADLRRWTGEIFRERDPRVGEFLFRAEDSPPPRGGSVTDIGSPIRLAITLQLFYSIAPLWRPLAVPRQGDQGGPCTWSKERARRGPQKRHLTSGARRQERAHINLLDHLVRFWVSSGHGKSVSR